MIYNILPFVYLAGCVLGWWTIFKKAGVAPWKSLIPIYNIVVWIQLLGKHWRWYIFMLIPAINIFAFLLLVVDTGKQFQRYNLIEQIVAVILPWAYLPYLGLSKRCVFTPADQLPPHRVSTAREWVEDIIFAVVAAVIIRNNVLEFYNIPSSSMEKSLMTGDYLMVSKMAYGPRVNMTPLSVPLVHNVMPLSKGNMESYLKWPQLPYHRYPGLGHVQRFDATVFNYPDGDTVCTAFQSNRSYHDLVRQYGRDRVLSDHAHFGKIVVRPFNKKENFIKRTIGLPGETITIKDRQVSIDGKPIEDPKDLQFTYAIRMKQTLNDYMSDMASMGINPMQLEQNKFDNDMAFFRKNFATSDEDLAAATYYLYLPIRHDQLNLLKAFAPYFNMEIIVRHDSNTADSNTGAPLLVQLAPDYGLANTEQEYNLRNMEIRNAFTQLTDQLKLSGTSEEDIMNSTQYYTLPLTHDHMLKMTNSDAVGEVIPIIGAAGYGTNDLFPHAQGYDWTVDNYGPVLIPAKGMTLTITTQNLPLYRRVIQDFEGNTVEVHGDQILINGTATTTYTFKQDYYWMMGDNRHNSADSRYWGFVPENHIAGKASLVIFSRDKERASGKGIRWERTFRKASKRD